MQSSFVMALVGLVVSAGLIIAVKRMSSNGRRASDVAFVRLIRNISFGFVGFMILLSSVHIVPAKNAGIVSQFNAATDRTTGAGLVWTLPYQDVDDWDASRRAFDKRGEHCVKVRIASQADACVEVLIEWQVRRESAPEQWAAYRRDIENFVNRRVDPNFVDVLNEVFSDHNPLLNIDKEGNLNVPLGPYATKTREVVQSRLAADVEILNVLVTRVNYDEKTQADLQRFQQAVVNARVLRKEEQNAEIQKRITETNAKVNPLARCLEIADEHGREPGLCMNGGNPTQVTNK